MTGWAKSNFGDHRDGFDTLHTGLTVELISTPRNDLKVCRADNQIADVINGNIEKYDYLPVVRSADDRKITGLFHTKEFPAGAPLVGTVAQNFTPLSEETIIGADSSILDFIWDADQKPCRLVVSGAHIVGLVSLSDLQRLPVRAALFAPAGQDPNHAFATSKSRQQRSDQTRKPVKSEQHNCSFDSNHGLRIAFRRASRLLRSAPPGGALSFVGRSD